MNLFNFSGRRGSVTINGVHYEGSSVRIDSDGVVIVDGKRQDDVLVGPISVTVAGNAEHVETASGNITVSGSAGMVKTMSGDVRCGDVGGSVSTMSGDVNCKAVAGSASSISGDIRGL